jgi:hypothetical protein
VCDRVRGSSGFSPFRLDVTVSGSSSRLSAGHRPPQLSPRVHPLVRFRSSPESLDPTPPSAFRLRAPSMGSHASFATSASGVHDRGHPKPAPFRPRRFSRPRRLAPLPALRVCFTPQPRPRFALQGVSLRHGRAGSSPASALLSLARLPCPRINVGARKTSPPSGLCSVPESVAVRGCLGPGTTRSPPELSLPRVLLRTPWKRFRAPSAHGLSRPPACRKRAAWPTLATGPSPFEVLGLPFCRRSDSS